MKTDPVLLLHGALGSRKQLDPLKECLSQSFAVESMDFIGHGEARAADRFDMHAFAMDIVGFMDRNGIARANFFGYSMGGYAALYLAQLDPHRVNRVMTLATKFQWDAASAEREASRLDPDIIEVKVPSFARQLAARHEMHGWKNVVRNTAAMMRALGGNPVVTPEVLGTIQQPVLVSVGDRDTMVSIEETVTAYRALPNGQFLVIPNTPHALDRVCTEQIGEAIKQFITS